MTASPHVCLVGQMLIDVTLPSHGNPVQLRAGGIMHAARALWAIDSAFTLCYCAPDYLTSEIDEHVKSYKATRGVRFGVVTGCPNVILIGEAKEAGAQGYEYLLRDRQQSTIDASALDATLTDATLTDCLVIPGGFDLQTVLPTLGKSKLNIYADANFDPQDATTFGLLGRDFESLIYSTSSARFLQLYDGRFDSLREQLVGKYAKSVMLKENRGGTRFATNGDVIQVPAQARKVQHSVGVGDCFDAVFIALRHRFPDAAALGYASCIAAEYASTTDPDVFRELAQGWLRVPADEIAVMSGMVVPWDVRKKIQIYIAAPDFDHIDRGPIDTVAAALEYHNFKSRLPVREHGMMGENASEERRQTLCDADLRLLDECQLLVAVMLYDDPGTLIEIGIAVERGIPVIVYDPYRRADNLMLTQLPFKVSADLDEVITAVFDRASWVLSR